MKPIVAAAAVLAFLMTTVITEETISAGGVEYIFDDGEEIDVPDGLTCRQETVAQTVHVPGEVEESMACGTATLERCRKTYEAVLGTVAVRRGLRSTGINDNIIVKQFEERIRLHGVSGIQDGGCAMAICVNVKRPKFATK